MRNKDSPDVESSELLSLILRLGDEWAAAEKADDVAFLDALLADEWQFTSTKGLLITKAEWLARPKISASPVKFDRSDVQVKLFGNTAVLTGTAIIESVHGSGVFLYADIFCLDSGTWRVVYSHFTPVAYDRS